MVSFPLHPARAARLLVLATKLAKPRALGGPGSGNFGHAGRPGEVGGSSSEGGPSKVIDHLYERYPVNPDSPNERIVRVSGRVVGDFEVEEREGRLRVKSIQSREEGAGSLILSRIIRAADQYGVTLELTASSKGSHKLSTDELKAWYGRHGFVPEPGEDSLGNTYESLGYMIREPKLRTASGRREEGPLHKLADSHSPKLSVGVRYAFAAARAAMRRKLQSREDIYEATTLGIVTLRLELKEILPSYLRKIYVDGGRVGADLLTKQLRVAGGPGSGNFGHSGRPGEVGGSGGGSNPLADEKPGEHTPAGQRKLIDYLEKATGQKFKPHGSVGRGETSKNDFDIVMQPPSQQELERMSDQANEYQSEIQDKFKRGEITEQQMMEELFGDSEHPVEIALRKIGFESESSVAFDGTPTGTGGDAEVDVIRHHNPKTGHVVEVWIPRTLSEFRTAKRKPSTKVSFSFNVKDERAIDWANRHAAELINGISETSDLLSKQLRIAEWNEEDHPRDEEGRWTDGGESGVAYYRGTNPESTERIKTGSPAHDEHLFVTDKVKGAKWYGSQIEQVDLIPSAKILKEGTKEFRKIAGTGRTKSMLEWSSNAIIKAKEAGYDVIHFARQVDIGTVVLNPAVIRQRKMTSLMEFRAAKREPSTKVSFSFNVKDERAIDWADRHAAELINQISETSREDINNAVAEFLETGDFSELRDEILAAVGDERRAEVIARNEPMVAVHEGQRAAWEQAVEEGLLPENAVREWIVVGDDKVCPICTDLEGKTAELGGEYEEGIEGPPAHVMCRCSEGISSKFETLGGQGSGNFGHAGRPGEVGGSSPDGSPEANSPEDAQRIIEEEQKKYLTPEEFERLPPGIRAWKTRTRKEKAEGKEPEKKPEPKKEPPTPKIEDKPTGVIATKDREAAINKRAQELYKDMPWLEANRIAREEDEEKHGELPPNAILNRHDAINERYEQLKYEARQRNNELAREGKPTVQVESEKLYRQAQEEDAQKWGPYTHPEEVEAIRQSDKSWSPSQEVARREAKLPVGPERIERENVPIEQRSEKQVAVRGVADQIAREMNFDPALITVRDRGNSPRTFELNGKTLTEGGHYNPTTGRIEVNAQFGVDKGLIVHEIQHAQWDYVESQAKEEQYAMQVRWSREQAADFAGTSYFLKNGKVKAAYRDEFEKQAPHLSMLARAGLGSKELGIKPDFEGMKKDDGVSQYSAEYWKQAAEKGGFGKDRANYIGELAVNETLSEISRRVRQPGSQRAGDFSYQIPERFKKLNVAVESLYSKDLDKVQRYFARKKNPFS